MSALTATTSGLFDPSQATSARSVSSVSSRPDESFWQGVFDRAETLGLATADAEVPAQAQGLGENPAQAGGRHFELSSDHTTPGPVEEAMAQAANSLPPPEPGISASDAAKPLTTAPWAPVVLNMPHAARWQAAQSYGLTPAEPIALPPSAPATQAPAAVNATLVTLPNGELKLYLRAAGLSASEAIEAASLADLPWPDGQAPDIAEVVLNGQTIYTRGVDTAPSFILTC
jgi:hypothetical protein